MKNPETVYLYVVGSGFDLASICFDKIYYGSKSI